MSLFWIMAIVALVFSSIGFKKYVWFISIGYGFSVAAIGVALLILGGPGLSAGTICASILFVLYGLRLGGYLAYRELKSASYNNKMKTEIKSGDGMGFGCLSVTESYLSQAEAGQIGMGQLSFSDFPVLGAASTYSADHQVTCSSAAATAFPPPSRQKPRR